MKNTGIRIKTNEKDVISFIISNSHSYLSKLHWKILRIEGTYVGDETILLEDQLSESEYGLPISFATVSTLINHINDLWDLLLVGQLEKSDPIEKNLPDEYIFEKYSLVIEFFDSTYWTIASSNPDFISSVKGDLEKAYCIEPLSI